MTTERLEMMETQEVCARAVLVHLSDLHFACDDPGLEERNALVRNRLIADVRRLLDDEIRLAADAVLVTGDISYSGREEEYDAATSWLQAVLYPITNGSTRILAVPGNHDVDWRRIGPSHEAHRVVLRDCPEDQLDALLDRYLNEDGQAILHPIGAYNEFAASLGCQIEDRYCWDAPLYIGGGYQVDFRGVTTVVNSFKGDGPGGLAVHRNQLLYNAEPGRIPVLLAHHDTHFWRRHHRLDGEVTNRMSIALYGHTHAPRLRKVDECLEITGGAVHPEEGPGWVPAYNILELDVSPPATELAQATLRVRVWRRRFSAEHDRFIPDVSSGTFEERTVMVQAAASQTAQEGPSDGNGEGDGDAPRVALTTPEGAPHPVRELQRQLYLLGSGDRIAVLASIGIEVNELARLAPHRLIPRAAQVLVENEKVKDFYNAIAERRVPISGGDSA